MLIQRHRERVWLALARLHNRSRISTLAFGTMSSTDNFKLEQYPLNIQRLASAAEEARKTGVQIQPFTDSQALSHEQAYQIAAACRGLRRNSGATPVGRKIGFTNKNIWPEYNIDASIWSYMYNNTVEDVVPGQTINLSSIWNLEPKIEPEIVFGISKTPRANMNDEELLSCIAWVAHGFEVVQSIFPAWKFTAADTIAGFGLHGRLLIGTKLLLNTQDSTQNSMASKLDNFDIELLRNGKTVDVGVGSNVLGGPLRALRHLVEILDRQSLHPQLQVGEVVTTGTLTRALPISDADCWETRLSGIALPGLRIKFSAGTRVSRL